MKRLRLLAGYGLVLASSQPAAAAVAAAALWEAAGRPAAVAWTALAGFVAAAGLPELALERNSTIDARDYGLSAGAEAVGAWLAAVVVGPLVACLLALVATDNGCGFVLEIVRGRRVHARRNA